MEPCLQPQFEFRRGGAEPNRPGDGRRQVGTLDKAKGRRCMLSLEVVKQLSLEVEGLLLEGVLLEHLRAVP